MSDEPAQIASVLFTHIGDRRYKCVLCSERDVEHEPFVSLKGYSNLMQHLNNKVHMNEWKEYYRLYSARETSGHTVQTQIRCNIIKASPKATLVCNTLKFVLDTHQPMNVVERRSFRDLIHHDEVKCAKTLRKYMFSLYNNVLGEIAKQLPDKFGIVLDGWSDGASNHMVSFFAACPVTNGCELILLGMNVLDDITNQCAQNHVDTLHNILSKYNKDLANVNFLVADNTNLNPAIANLLRVPFIGCASHKLNLAVRKFLLSYEDIIEKVDKVMSKIKNSNTISGQLKEAQKALNKPALKPVTRNVTRWSSTFAMLTRYDRIEEVLRDERMIHIHHLLLTVRELSTCKTLLKSLDDLEYVNKELQKEECNLAYARTLFDNLLELYGNTDPAFKQYLRVNPTNHFENGIVALTRKQPLTHYQKVHLKRFLVGTTSASEDQPSENPTSLKERVEQEVKRQRVEQSTSEGSYMSMVHVLPTSNCCERINSQGRLEKDYTRMKASNKMFEVRMMLRSNASYWNALSIDKILLREKNKNAAFLEDAQELEEVDDSSPTREFLLDGPRVIECPDVSDEDFELAMAFNE